MHTFEESQLLEKHFPSQKYIWLEFNLALLPYNPSQGTTELQLLLLSIQKGHKLGHKDLKARKTLGSIIFFADEERLLHWFHLFLPFSSLLKQVCQKKPNK